jgi:hypothetical protein
MGPAFASQKGVLGILFPCGHFRPGPLPGEAGARVKTALARVIPCEVCYPGGAHFIQAAIAPLGGEASQ